MRVKIGEVWYSTEYQPICIQISEFEQNQISEMDRSIAKSGKYAVFPDSEESTAEEKFEWMQG